MKGGHSMKGGYQKNSKPVKIANGKNVGKGGYGKGGMKKKGY